MLLVGAANTMNTINRPLVTNMASERIARVRRVDDEAASANYIHNDFHPTRLRVCWMYFDEFCHARIVGEPGLRA